MADMTLGEMADSYRDYWDKIDELQKQIDEFKKTTNSLQAQILAEMENQEIDNYKTDRITLTKVEEIVPKVTDWEAIQTWMADNHRWEFMRRQLNTAPFREMIESGEPVPSGLEPVAIVKLNRRRK